ncbi:hypothetical protein FWH09_01380, partial [Candidatus Saccharibacteria bacterium]|nr:hypothetical protein [Candidatus Saccharibacteria bacterium]
PPQNVLHPQATLYLLPGIHIFILPHFPPKSKTLPTKTAMCISIAIAAKDGIDSGCSGIG